MIKKLALTTTILATAMFCYSSAFAVQEINSGFYVGINLGYGKMKETISGSTFNKTTGFGGRVDVGYKFVPTFATEFGFSMFRNGRFSNGVTTTNNFLLDLALKAILPFKNGFSVFGKVGPAVLNHKYDDPNGVLTDKRAGTHMKPTIFGAIGASYSFTPNIALNGQVAATAKNGKNAPATFLATAGITYIIPLSYI